MIYQKWNLKINGRTGKQQVLHEHLLVYARQLQGTAVRFESKGSKWLFRYFLVFTVLLFRKSSKIGEP